MMKMKKLSKKFGKAIDNMKKWLSGIKMGAATNNGGNSGERNKKRNW